MATLNSFEELECWKACREVVRWVSKIVKAFPSEKKYGLVKNMREAARSSTRNIAEGFGRFHYQENIQFCRICRGSLEEVLDDAITALEDSYLSEEEFLAGRGKIKRAKYLVNRYILYLKSKL